MAKRKSLQTTALLYIIVGVLFIIFKALFLDWMMTAIGLLFIVNGIIDIARKRTLAGVVGIVIGAIVILCGWTFVDLVLTIFGVLLTAKGALDLLRVIGRRRLIPLVSAILTIVIGVLFIVGNVIAQSWFYILIGVVLIVDGITALIR